MSDAGRELNEIALALEHQALMLPRHLAAMVLTVAAARIAGDAPEAERTKVREHGERGWQTTLAEYDAREAAQPPKPT